MEFNEYQQRATLTAIYPNMDKDFVYPVLGLAGESGEVAEKIKKIIRDKGGVIDEDDRYALAKELGDVLWYVSQVARVIGVTLEDVAKMNIDKLNHRKQNDTLRGSGDNR